MKVLRMAVGILLYAFGGFLVLVGGFGDVLTPNPVEKPFILNLPWFLYFGLGAGLIFVATLLWKPGSQTRSLGSVVPPTREPVARLWTPAQSTVRPAAEGWSEFEAAWTSVFGPDYEAVLGHRRQQLFAEWRDEVSERQKAGREPSPAAEFLADIALALQMGRRRDLLT